MQSNYEKQLILCEWNNNRVLPSSHSYMQNKANTITATSSNAYECINKQTPITAVANLSFVTALRQTVVTTKYYFPITFYNLTLAIGNKSLDPHRHLPK